MHRLHGRARCRPDHRNLSPQIAPVHDELSSALQKPSTPFALVKISQA